jgi:hypothetical protein
MFAQLTSMIDRAIYFSTRDVFILAKRGNNGWGRTTKTLMPQGEEAATRAWAVAGVAAVRVYKSPSLLQRRITRHVLRSFTEKPRAPNSMEQLLSRVN